jgi:hypothetical protein
MRWFTAGLICLLFISAISPARPGPALVEFFSFEQDFEGWAANGLDLQAGSGATIPWSITRSQDMAKDGLWSVRLFIDNINDAGKIWIQRPFTMQPNQTYQVKLGYFFAPIDSQAFSNPIIAGASTQPPATRDDLVPFFEDRTSLGRNTGANRWARHEYEFTAQADGVGSLYVFIGVWATFEVGYVYYLDAVRTTFTMRQTGAPEPIIESVNFNGTKKLRISGSAFGPSPSVIINNIDRSEFITASSDSVIKLKGSLSDFVGVGTVIRVVDRTTAAASEPFRLTGTN